MRNWKFNHIDFSTYPFYAGTDLGVCWSPEKTTIKIWAPTAHAIELRLYKDGQNGEAFHKTTLQPDGKGIWTAILKGDYQGKFYTIRVNDGEWLDEVPDIYARCVGVNGKRGMIFNPQKTNPENWENDKRVELPEFTDAVIYETHIRDFSIAENSGIKNRGKYIGFTEANTKTKTGKTTGLDHLKELGITHVHLLPVSDFLPSMRKTWLRNTIGVTIRNILMHPKDGMQPTRTMEPCVLKRSKNWCNRFTVTILVLFSMWFTIILISPKSRFLTKPFRAIFTARNPMAVLPMLRVVATKLRRNAQWYGNTLSIRWSTGQPNFISTGSGSI